MTASCDRSNCAPSSVPTQASRFYFLDAWRGIAALMVMFYHIHMDLIREGIYDLPYLLRWFSSFGYVGVQIFFVLSGFVITHSLMQLHISAGTACRFALRRSIRLDPLYWTAIAATLLVNAAEIRYSFGKPGPWPTIGDVILNALYINDIANYFHHVPWIVEPGWTLCLEIRFYLACLLILALAQRLRAASFVLLFLPLTLASLASRAEMLPVPSHRGFLDEWCIFALGMTLAAIVNWRFKVWPACILIAALLALGVATRTPANLAPAGFGLILLGAIRCGKLQSLNVPLLQYFGRISYSLYLVHLIVGRPFLQGLTLFVDKSNQTTATAFLAFAVVCVLAVATADIAYRWIERPSHQLSRRIRLTA